MTQRPHDRIIRMRPVQILAYGCVRCQTTHYERGEEQALFAEHLMYQSKHGWYVVQDRSAWEMKP